METIIGRFLTRLNSLRTMDDEGASEPT